MTPVTPEGVDGTPVDDLLPSLSIPLPGRWFALDLDDGENVVERIAMIAELVQRATAGATDAATARDVLLDMVEFALDHDACSLYLSDSLAPGLDVPLVLTVCWPYVPLALPTDLAVELRLGLLGQVADALQGGPGDADADVVTVSGARVRRVREVGELLEVEHWLLPDGAQRPARLVWSVPAMGLRDEWIDLLDGMAAHTRWGASEDELPFLVAPTAPDGDE